jgi:hypothetical protein
MQILEAHRKIIYAKNATWWEFPGGSMADAKKIHNSCKHQYFDGEFGPLCKRARERPVNFLRLSPERQWDIDKELGVLDWDGDPST